MTINAARMPATAISHGLSDGTAIGPIARIRFAEKVSSNISTLARVRAVAA